jgi:hypothetical protein
VTTLWCAILRCKCLQDIKMAAPQPLGGEKDHLGVVCNGTNPAEVLDEVPDSVGAETLPHFGKAHELYGRAEGVTHGPAKQASPEAVLQSGGDGMASSAGERCVLLSHGFYVDSRSEGDWIIFRVDDSTKALPSSSSLY